MKFRFSYLSLSMTLIILFVAAYTRIICLLSECNGLILEISGDFPIWIAVVVLLGLATGVINFGEEILEKEEKKHEI